LSPFEPPAGGRGPCHKRGTPTKPRSTVMATWAAGEADRRSGSQAGESASQPMTTVANCDGYAKGRAIRASSAARRSPGGPGKPPDGRDDMDWIQDGDLRICAGGGGVAASSQARPTPLSGHASWAHCRIVLQFHVDTVTLRRMYVLSALEIETATCTSSASPPTPDGRWTSQQAATSSSTSASASAARKCGTT
jgi:hypothetical protein